MKINIKAGTSLGAILSIFVMLLAPAVTSAAADTCTWTGATNANWSNGGNWTGCDNGDVPENGDALVFPSGGANKTDVNDLGAMSFTTLTFAGNYTISGGALTITGGTISITSGTATIHNNLVLGANLAVTPTGAAGWLIDGDVNLASHTLTVDTGANGTSLGGVISGTGNLVKNNAASSLTLPGNNTYSGTTTINAGSVSITNSNSLGTAAGGTTVVSGATINIFAGGLTIPEPLTISGTGNVGGGALRNFTGASTWSGDIAVGANDTYLNSDSGSFLTVTGHLTGAFIDLELGGNIIFTNSNTFTGPYSILNGDNLFFNSTNAASLANLGTATINGTGSVGDITSTGATQINPGSNGVGTLSTGNLSLNSAGTLTTELRNGASDKLAVTGTVNLAGSSLATDLNYDAPNGTQFTIIDNDSSDAITGTFAGKAEGSTFTTGGTFAGLVRISYVGGTGNDVVLTVIRTAAAAGSGATLSDTGIQTGYVMIFAVATILAAVAIRYYKRSSVIRFR